MGIDPEAMLAIVLMALATYATRAGGLWLASRLTLSGRVEAWLGYIPGAILVSLVAPAVLASGLAEAFAGLAVVLVALRTRSLPLAMVAGVGAVLLFRTLAAGIS